MSHIFISYRREDAKNDAAILYAWLSDHFGSERVFMDIDTIRPGEDFKAVIEESCSSSRVLLAVIGRLWATVQKDGHRRLDDEGDYVRLEISYALRRGVRVIPVLVDGADIPTKANLPPDLQALADRQAWRLSKERFGHDVKSLISEIENAIRPKLHDISGRWLEKVWVSGRSTGRYLRTALRNAYQVWQAPKAKRVFWGLAAIAAIVLAARVGPYFLSITSSDSSIGPAIRSALRNDSDLKNGAVQVTVRNATVTLTGEVHDEYERVRAEAIVAREAGVRQVINNLRVATLPTRENPNQPTDSRRIDDVRVTEKETAASQPVQNVSFTDDFTSDRSLNGTLWTTTGEILNPRMLKADTRLVPVQLGFGSRGMTVAGVSGTYQSTGIQSRRSFSPPLALEATVMGTVSNGNPVALYLVSADGSQYLAVNCNLDSRNGSYSGISFGYTGRGSNSGNEQTDLLMREVQMGVWYVIKYVIDEHGIGAVTIEDQHGTLLAKQGKLNVGSGPFFIALAQWEGWPHTIGPNEAVWSSVVLSNPVHPPH